METFKCLVSPAWDSISMYHTIECHEDVIALVAKSNMSWGDPKKVSVCLSKEDAIRFHEKLGELLEEI